VSNSELSARDLAHVWHPCTQMKDHEDFAPIPIRRGAGAWLEDFDGHRYLDAISSWWVNLFGHSNPQIGQAVHRQLDDLEHVLLAGFTHRPVIELSEALVRIAPPGLTRCFYADNGSSAIEVALKMSFHYWRNSGRPGKRRFITLANSYHGETLGALAVGDVGLYRDIYRPLLMDVIVVPSPDAYERGGGELGGSCTAPVRGDGGGPRRAFARGRGGDRRAAGAVRRGNAHVRPGIPAAAARGLRRAPGASHRR